MKITKSFSNEEIAQKSLEYFNGDDLASSTFLKKYALREIKNGSSVNLEATPDDMHERLTNEFVKIENKYPNPVSYDTIYDALKNFQYIVPGGSVMYGAGNPFVNVSLSNCVVVDSPTDDISGIMDTGKDLANLFKARCGAGLSLDTLRPEGMKVSNAAGTSTGAWSFAEYYSNVCRMIGQSGRRGALALTMNVKHPDIEKFITMKRDLTTVTGANVSVMITDDFMQAVHEDTDWVLQWPIDVLLEDAKITKIVKAKDLWHLINESAVKFAEPGLIFIDNYNKNLPANEYPDFKSICINPCGEVILSKFDSCRLTSINLKSFVDNPFSINAKFNYKKFEEIVRLAMHILDDIVDLEIDALQNLINKVDTNDEKNLWEKLRNAAIQGRRTGLGAYGLADALARLQLRYDSDEAIAETDKIFTCFRNSAYDESVNLAIERGPFPVFDWDIEKNNIFIQRLPEKIKKRIAEHGRRNISLLTVPPTGTISIVSQASSGLEPVFNNMYTRRVKTDNDANVTFTDDKGDRWTEFVVFHHNVHDYLKTNPEILNQWETFKKNKPSDEWGSELKKIIPDYFITSHEIDPIKRVEMQGVIQKSICHGISSTINMPKETTIEQGQELYEKAHEVGCKGITIYVEGSRAGVLINKESNPENIKESIAPKRPKELPCEIHHSTIDDNKWTIFVGLLDGKPYEMFGGLSEYVTIPKRYKNGKIVKLKNGKKNVNGRYAFYNLIIDDGDDDPLEIQNIAVTFNDGNYAAQTRMISLALRHGVPVQYIAEQLGRDENSHFFSFSKVMARVLKKYIDDGVIGTDTCEICKEKLRFEGGCQSCPSCGNSIKCN